MSVSTFILIRQQKILLSDGKPQPGSKMTKRVSLPFVSSGVLSVRRCIDRELVKMSVETNRMSEGVKELHRKASDIN